MSTDRTFEALTLILEQSDQFARVEVPADHRLVILTNADAAVAAPVMPAGTYTASAEAFAGCSPFPVAVSVVPEVHVPSWTSLSQEQVSRILARCTREVSALRATGARIQ